MPFYLKSAKKAISSANGKQMKAQRSAKVRQLRVKKRKDFTSIAAGIYMMPVVFKFILVVLAIVNPFFNMGSSRPLF